MLTNNCGEISPSIKTPVSIMSLSFISLSKTISAPVFALDNSTAAIVTLYIFSFTFVAISWSIPKNLLTLFEPSCSKALLNSGWNITINAMTP